MDKLLVENGIVSMMNYFGKDRMRIQHAIKVNNYARIIGRMEQLNEHEQQLLEIAAVFHDIGIKVSEEKYNSSAARYQELEGPAVARMLLQSFGLPEDVLKRICFLIGHHHTFSAIDGTDFQILVEADFLVNMYEDEMSEDQILKFKKNIFKTTSGIKLLNAML
jgi:CRISPR/Cas system-associated endonuclease Cas3-HD